MGKTAIAAELARHIGALHLRIDSIEHAIRASGVVGESIDDVGYRVAYAVAHDSLRIGRTVIGDSVNPFRLTRDAWVAVAARAHVTAIEIEVQCSDVREHRRRVESRTTDVPGLKLATWNEVVNREYHPWGPRTSRDRHCGPDRRTESRHNSSSAARSSNDTSAN